MHSRGIATPCAMADDGTTSGEAAEVADTMPAAAPPSKKFDLKSGVDKGGAGFNQFDPVLSLSGFLSRRFGIFGGLGLVVLLAATEGREILKSLFDTGPVAASGETVTTPSGLQYQDILISNSGDTPLPGAVIGFIAVVSIGEKVLFDTRAEKAIAFKYGQRPFASIVCEGVEEGIKGMRPGGKRKLLIPASLAPKGVELPPGVPLVYEVELTEVLPGYF
uniref:peptidylprolyl isomerase n=1 Tax=Coccolithus braarudii TaxID=221442 RepID=A0A7S0Q4H6_9EUKA